MSSTNMENAQSSPADVVQSTEISKDYSKTKR